MPFLGVRLGVPQISGGNIPGFVPNPGNPPDIAFDFTQNLAWKKSGGVFSASSLLTIARGSAAFVNNSAGNWSSLGNNVLRISNLGLYVEEGRTNITLTAAQPSPDGGANAYTMTDNGTSGQHAVANGGITIVAGTTYAFSIYLKAGAGAQGVAPVRLAVANSGFTNIFQCSFDPTTGATSNNSAVGTATLVGFYSTVYPNGWVKCTVVGSLDPVADTTAKPTVYFNNGSSYVGTGSTVNIWQSQLEASAAAGVTSSSSTSPIVTSGATASRSGENIAATLAALGLSLGASWSYYAKFNPQSPVVYNSIQSQLELGDGGANRLAIRRISGTGVGTISGAGGTVALGNGVSLPQFTTAKIAAAFAIGDCAFSENGAAVITNAGNPPVGMTTLWMGATSGGSFFANGFVQQAAFWGNARVPNGQLQSMST